MRFCYKAFRIIEHPSPSHPSNSVREESSLRTSAIHELLDGSIEISTVSHRQLTPEHRISNHPIEPQPARMNDAMLYRHFRTLKTPIAPFRRPRPAPIVQAMSIDDPSSILGKCSAFQTRIDL
jgi:hypothetical protein